MRFLIVLLIALLLIPDIAEQASDEENAPRKSIREKMVNLFKRKNTENDNLTASQRRPLLIPSPKQSLNKRRDHINL